MATFQVLAQEELEVCTTSLAKLQAQIEEVVGVQLSIYERLIL